MAKGMTSEGMEQIIENRWLVEFNRKPLDKYPLFGFMLAWNDEFTLIHEFDRNLFRLDGFVVFRNESVKTFSVYAEPDYFLYEVIKFEKIRPQMLPQISIESWPEVLRTATEDFPLLVIEQEAVDRGMCYIGRLVEIKTNSFVLRSIDKDAEWDKNRKYKFRDLTKVEFGGRYENVLASVNAKRDVLENK